MMLLSDGVFGCRGNAGYATNHKEFSCGDK